MESFKKEQSLSSHKVISLEDLRQETVALMAAFTKKCTLTRTHSTFTALIVIPLSLHSEDPSILLK